MRARSRRPAAPCASPAGGCASEVEIIVDDDGPGIRPEALEQDLRALLHRPAGPGLRPEFRPRPVDLQADRRGPWRPPLGREPHAPAPSRRRAPRCSARASSCACRRCDGRQLRRVHASAVLVGARAVLIRGPSGSGKSRLALALIAGRAARAAAVRPAGRRRPRPCSKPRTGGCWCARPPALAGLIEVRGLGIRRLRTSRSRWSDLVVDLARDRRRAAAGSRGAGRDDRRRSRCRGLPSQPAPTPCRLVLGAICDAKPRLILATAGGANCRESNHIRAYGRCRA